MAKRKKNKKHDSIWSKLLFWRSAKKSKRRGQTESTVSVQIILRILAAAVTLIAIVLGLAYLNQYVRTIESNQAENVSLELASLPSWVASSTVLQDRIAAVAGGKTLSLSENTAKDVTTSLEAFPWMYDVSVRINMHDDPSRAEPLRTLLTKAKYRKPIARFQHAGKQYYIAPAKKDDPLYQDNDRSIVVLEYLPLEAVTTVQITGFASRPPTIDGTLWQSPEVISAVELLSTLARMDRISTPDKPLLDEITRIDLTNYRGRKNSRRPHIVLHAKDGTEVWWGAAYGESARYAESTEKEKIASLYTFYKEHGSLKNAVKYIDLRIAQLIFPRPME